MNGHTGFVVFAHGDRCAGIVVNENNNTNEVKVKKERKRNKPGGASIYTSWTGLSLALDAATRRDPSDPV